MVEITRTPEQVASQDLPDGSPHRLMYCKSRVFVNPTAYSRDNIPGFVAVVKQETSVSGYWLAWIPERLLNEKGASEREKFSKIEERPAFDDEDDDTVLIDLPTQTPESYAFSVALSSVYSLIVHPPSLSSWHGTVSINLISEKTMPTLHFHDDQSHSFAASASPRGSSAVAYPPSSSAPKTPSWGGEEFLSRLRQYAHLMRSTLDSNLYLVDPSRQDAEAHSITLFDDDAVDDILNDHTFTGHSPVPTHRRPRPLATHTRQRGNHQRGTSILHQALPPQPSSSSDAISVGQNALLQSFAHITRNARNAAQQILSHPLAQPILPHLPDPVRTFVSAPGQLEWGTWVEKGGLGEFESARVYLARWARVVAEEGERARRREAIAIPSEDKEKEEEGGLGVFQLLQSSLRQNLPEPKSTRDPQHPVDEAAWIEWFDKLSGKPKITFADMKKEIFRRGVKPCMRKEAWLYLLDVYPWDSTTEERKKCLEDKRRRYRELRNEWCGVPEVFERANIIEERHRIDVDCRRTDRNHPVFAAPDSVGKPPKEKLEADAMAEAQDVRYAHIAPESSEGGGQSPTNLHVERLGTILLTYGFLDKDLGYVQGMSDLCAPIYVVMGADEELTFWCFVDVMKRMTQNFLRDQSGMKRQLTTLQELISVMDSDLYSHFEKTESLNLFFCFRWVLISFKREFPFDNVVRLWENLWTDHYSVEFVLFVALAILESHRDVILRYLVEFDEILKYCNELSMTVDLDSTLAQAEVLFLSFKQLVEDIDRRKAEEAEDAISTNQLRRRRAAAEAESKAKLALPIMSDGLRGLLSSTRSA